MRAFLFALGLGLLIGASSLQLQYEDDVAVLDPSNFDEFIAQELSLVEFYAPWCGHCKSLAPEWAKAAGKARQLTPPVQLAKVDADKHRDLAERYDVNAYPTIKWFKKGEPEDYFGPNKADAIVKSVRREMIRDAAASSTTRLGVTSAAVVSADMQAVLEEGKGYALVGLFREPIGASSMYRTFSDAAAELPYTIERKVKVAFGAGATAEQLDALKGEFGVKQVPALLLFRPGEAVESMHIPRKRTEFTEDAVTSWIKTLLN